MPYIFRKLILKFLPNNNRRRPHGIIEDDEKMECCNLLDLIEQDTTYRFSWATVRYYPQTSPLKDYYAENSEKCKDYIECIKKMFALGKSKKVTFGFLVLICMFQRRSVRNDLRYQNSLYR